MPALLSKLNLMPAGSMTIALETEHVFSIANGTIGKAEAPKKSNFALFSEHWLQMQTYIQSTLTLPVTTGDFEEKYGVFDEKAQLVSLVEAMKHVQDLSVEFGTPESVIKAQADDPNYISKGKEGPLYVNILWIGYRIKRTAKMFRYSIEMLDEQLDPKRTTPAQRKKNLAAILTGKNGMVDQASAIAKDIGELVQRLTDFDLKMADANAKLKAYTTEVNAGTGETLRKKVQKAISRYVDEIKTLQDAAAAANKKWRDMTIAASSTSAGLLILTAGLMLPVVAAVGGTLGGLAQQQKNRYNGLMKQIAGEEAEKKKKVRLETDLDGFDREIPKVSESMSKFVEKLEEIASVWIDTKLQLEAMATENALDELVNLDFEEQRASIIRAQMEWKEIEETTRQFTENSLVRTSPGAFGTQVA
ncbi:MAG: hypothetical protein JF584_12140 [Acidobacteria bacterium]|nr:hypothetical protein [Acidobacteriota bacterium]